MRSLSIYLLVCLSVCTTVCWGKYDVKYGRQNISVGQRRLNHYPPDVLLFHDNPRISSKFLRVQSEDICYPPQGTYGRSFVITAFNVTNTLSSKQGGYIFVDKGGVDFNNLCLHLKTRRGGSYSFLVEIWGYYIN